jgi:hypothetical protein
MPVESPIAMYNLDLKYASIRNFPLLSRANTLPKLDIETGIIVAQPF